MKYENVIFDIGNVILNFDMNRILSEYTNDVENQKFIYDNIFNSPEWIGYGLIDTGLLSIENAIKIVQDRTNHIKDELIHDFWNNYHQYSFIEKNVIGIIEKLKNKGYKIYLLSNINEFTIDYIKETSNLFDIVDGCMLSYEVNSIKPYKNIYQELFKKYNISPQKSVFFDDNIANIKTGLELGLKAVLVSKDDYVDIQNKIEKLGL